MKNHTIFIFILILTSLSLTYLILHKRQLNDPVIKFVNEHIKGRRKYTFIQAIELINKRKPQVIIETGTTRGGTLAYNGDGGFTIIFGLWSQLHNAQLFSVDINHEAVQKAQTVVAPYNKYVQLIEMDSVKFLENFNNTIDFLYLDSFDFDKNNPYPSQTHHLNEIKAAYDKLTPSAIVMIDDCDLPHGGKGKLVIQYLEEKGWRIYAQDYQVIMVRM